MKSPNQDSARPRHARHLEQVILFSIARRTFAIAAESVQEIRSTDSLAGAASELDQEEVAKVHHIIERARRTCYVVSGCAHFGLPVTRPTLALILRQFRVAVLVDEIQRMAEIPAVYSLPRGFIGDERSWYRGLAYLEDQIIPVVHPAGFLTRDEFDRLDAIVRALESQHQMEGAAQ